MFQPKFRWLWIEYCYPSGYVKGALRIPLSQASTTEEAFTIAWYLLRRFHTAPMVAVLLPSGQYYCLPHPDRMSSRELSKLAVATGGEYNTDQEVLYLPPPSHKTPTTIRYRVAKQILK